jgi:hypothetical protein
MFQCCKSFFSKVLGHNRPVRWSIVMKEKQSVGFPLFGVLPSDYIPKVTKDFTVYFFIQSSNSSKLYQRIPVNYTR